MKAAVLLGALALSSARVSASVHVGDLLGLDFAGHGTVDASDFGSIPVGLPVAITGHLRFATPLAIFDDTAGPYYFGGDPDDWTVDYGIATVWSLMNFPLASLTLSRFDVTDFSFGGVISGDQRGEVTRTTFSYGEFDPGDGTPTGSASGHWTLDSFTTEVIVIDRIPEPAAWLLLGGGFGVAGGALRRHRAAGGSLPMTSGGGYRI